MKHYDFGDITYYARFKDDPNNEIKKYKSEDYDSGIYKKTITIKITQLITIDYKNYLLEMFFNDSKNYNEIGIKGIVYPCNKKGQVKKDAKEIWSSDIIPDLILTDYYIYPLRNEFLTSMNINLALIEDYKGISMSKKKFFKHLKFVKKEGTLESLKDYQKKRLKKLDI